MSPRCVPTMVGRAAGKIRDFKGPKTPFSLIFKLVFSVFASFGLALKIENGLS